MYISRHYFFYPPSSLFSNTGCRWTLGYVGHMPSLITMISSLSSCYKSSNLNSSNLGSPDLGSKDLESKLVNYADYHEAISPTSSVFSIIKFTRRFWAKSSRLLYLLTQNPSSYEKFFRILLVCIRWKWPGIRIIFINQFSGWHVTGILVESDCLPLCGCWAELSCDILTKNSGILNRRCCYIRYLNIKF